MDFSLMKDFMERLTALGIPGNSISVCFEGKSAETQKRIIRLHQ